MEHLELLGLPMATEFVPGIIVLVVIDRETDTMPLLRRCLDSGDKVINVIQIQCIASGSLLKVDARVARKILINKKYIKFTRVSIRI
jgi:hypothetical protein